MDDHPLSRAAPEHENLIFESVASAPDRFSTKDLGLLVQVADILFNSADPATLIPRIFQQISDRFQIDTYLHHVPDPNSPGKSLMLESFTGIQAEALPQLRHTVFNQALCGTVAYQRKPLVRSKIQDTDEEKAKLLKAYGIKAYASWPLLRNETLLGVLSFASHKKDCFTDQELSLFEHICGIVAATMERLLLQQRLQELNATLERRVVSRTAMVHRQAEQLRAFARRLIAAENDERRRTAQALHENFQQVVAAARVKIEAILRRDSSRNYSAAEQIKAMLNEAIEGARTLANELSPPLLRDRGLADALRWLARTMQQMHGLCVTIKLNAQANPEDPDVADFLFQAARALLRNVIKHAQTRQANLSLEPISDDRLRLIVEDAGRGDEKVFRHLSQPAGGDLGLFHIRQRLELIGGDLSVVSEPGRGLKVTLTAPRAAHQPESLLRSATDAAAEATNHPSDTAEISDLSNLDASETRTAPIRLLIVDDHQMFRESLASMLVDEPGLRLVGEAADGRTALDLARALHPDVILMDVKMPIMDGIEATRLICNELKDTKVVGLSMHVQEEMIEAMREAGASAYLTKEQPIQELVEVIRQEGERGNR